ncbi:MAG: ADYC domain-containing protein [Nannocystaceae bacterium]
MAVVVLRRICALGALVLLAPTGCEIGPTGDFASFEGAITPRGVEDNSAQLNGFRLNGFGLNGFRLNGFRLNSGGLNSDEDAEDYIEIVDVELQGNKLATDAYLEDSKLYLFDKKGKAVADNKIKHVTILYEMTDTSVGVIGGNKEVALRSVTALTPGSDVWLYTADVRESGGAWEPLCIDAEGGATEAILIGHAWDPATGERLPDLDGTVTFACRGAALAKCIEWGYRPWAELAGVSLRDFHQACTRMVRADYCGDGIAHTLTGTPIHVLDTLDIQIVDPNYTYAVEAEWGPDGAVCFNAANARHPELTVDCSLPSCGGAFSSGGILQSGKILSGP